MLGTGYAAEDVASADDEGDLDAITVDFFYLLGDLTGGFDLYAVVAFAEDGFAADFEEDTLVFGFGH